jgi:two-component system chemotaxis response regulator CheY
MSGKKALVVDDAYFMRTLIKNALKKEGYHVVGEAKNGMEGIKLFMELKPDFVTMDINMPDISGIEAIRQILAIDPNARIIAITGNDKDDIRDEAMKAGATEYLKKPFQPAFLMTKIENLFIEKELPSVEIATPLSVTTDPVVLADDVPEDDFENREIVVLNKPDESRDRPLVIENDDDRILFPEEELSERDKYALSEPSLEAKVLEYVEASQSEVEQVSSVEADSSSEIIVPSKEDSSVTDQELTNSTLTDKPVSIELPVVSESVTQIKSETVPAYVPELEFPTSNPPNSIEETSSYIQIKPPRGKVLSDPNYGRNDDDVEEPIFRNGEVITGSDRKKGIKGLFRSLFKK